MLNALEIHPKNEQKIKTLLLENAELLDDLSSEPFETQTAWFSKFIIHFLTDLEFSETEAMQHYMQILEHRFLLSGSLNRDIGLRVATLDYFLHVFPSLKNPRIIEISLFEELLQTTKQDSKTGCYNAKFLHEFTLREIHRAERNGHSVSLMLIDIDNFKHINDHYGHMTGDRVIKDFAEVMLRNARSEDIVSRFGGDEFALLMPHTGRVGARCLAERVRSSMAESFLHLEHDGRKIPITFSAGIATFPADASNYETLIQQADRTLYHAKRIGKNRIFDNLELGYQKSVEQTQNRRNFSRFGVKSQLEVSLKGSLISPLLPIHARVVDISIDGVLLECTAELQADVSGLALDLGFENTKNGLSQKVIPAKIVRNFTESNRMKFFLGLRFQNMMDPAVLQDLEKDGLLIPPVGA